MKRYIPQEILRSFFRHGGLHLAGDMAFCALFSIIPLTMIMVSVGSFFLGSSSLLLEEFSQAITTGFPVLSEEIFGHLRSLIAEKSSIGLLGAVTLLFIATIIFGSLEHSLDVVFQSPRRRNFLHSHILGGFLIFLISLIFFIPTMLRILGDVVEKYGFSFPFSYLFEGDVFILLSAFLSYLLVVIIAPNHKVFFRYAFLGGLVFALGIAVAKQLFGWYMLTAISRYNLIYGSLAAVMMLLVWIYYVCIVVLIASETVSVFQSHRLFHRQRKAV